MIVTLDAKNALSSVALTGLLSKLRYYEFEMFRTPVELILIGNC